MLVVLAALSLLWALRWPMSRSLGCYLVAELLYIPFVMLAWRVFGPSVAYGWVYAVFTGIILAAVLWLAWESMARARYRLRSVVTSMLLAGGYVGLAVVDLSRPVQWYDVIVLVEGATLFWAATVVGMSAPYALPKWPDISIGLSVLWIAQSLVDLGYCMHYPRWNTWSEVASPVIGAAGFGYIGWRLRRRQLRRSGCRSQAVGIRSPF